MKKIKNEIVEGNAIIDNVVSSFFFEEDEAEKIFLSRYIKNRIEMLKLEDLINKKSIGIANFLADFIHCKDLNFITKVMDITNNDLDNKNIILGDVTNEK